MSPIIVTQPVPEFVVTPRPPGDLNKSILIKRRYAARRNLSANPIALLRHANGDAAFGSLYSARDTTRSRPSNQNVATNSARLRRSVHGSQRRRRIAIDANPVHIHQLELQ